MNDLLNTLPSADWLDKQAALEPDREHQDAEAAIKNHKDARKATEAELMDFASQLKMSASSIEKDNKLQNEFAANLIAQDEREVHDVADEDDSNAIVQAMVAHSLVTQTVTGGGPGHYYDFNPYHKWGQVYTHNEGGLTHGSAGINLAARKMYPYAYARGDGSGISDDNDVTVWTKLYFAFWPTRNGHVRAFVPYTTRGVYRIYANDKWYNSKDAVVDFDMHVQLYQNYWGGLSREDVFRLADDNINRNGRIDLSRTLYSGSLPIGANKWVIAEVATRLRVETEGSGSTAMLDFRSPDYIFVPYVRFDFS